MITIVVSRLLMPPAGPLLGLLLALLFRMVGWRKTAWFVALVSVGGLWALSTPRLADELARGLEHEMPVTPVADVPEADAIVVLGGGISRANPPRESADLAEAADRVLHAARLYRAGKAPLVVATGGYPAHLGAPRAESAETAALLAEWGVPEDAILAEEGSLDTHENAVETARLLGERDATTVILVTSALHMPRALETFQATELTVIPAPTDYTVVEGGEATVEDWIPSAAALHLSARVLHEWLGRAWYRLRGWT